ncbi:MAG: hypothetical protein HQL73_03610 [Magnetococcales bacterium]|nr:hypothetical protein [Magnetococcales bacterium]
MARIETTMEELEAVIGVKATAYLISTLGGTRVYIPKAIESTHRLNQIIGPDKSKRISKVMGGGYLVIPKGSRKALSMRDASIVKAYRAGTKVPMLAREYSLTERRVYDIIAKERVCHA